MGCWTFHENIVGQFSCERIVKFVVKDASVALVQHRNRSVARRHGERDGEEACHGIVRDGGRLDLCHAGHAVTVRASLMAAASVVKVLYIQTLLSSVTYVPFHHHDIDCGLYRGWSRRSHARGHHGRHRVSGCRVERFGAHAPDRCSIEFQRSDQYARWPRSVSMGRTASGTVSASSVAEDAARARHGARCSSTCCAPICTLMHIRTPGSGKS